VQLTHAQLTSQLLLLQIRTHHHIERVHAEYVQSREKHDKESQRVGQGFPQPCQTVATKVLRSGKQAAHRG
jgi:hypothetical protein